MTAPDPAGAHPAPDPTGARPDPNSSGAHPDADPSETHPDLDPGVARPRPGRTIIRDRAVARIVAKAAEEIDESGGLGRTVLGVPLPGRGPARTEVRVNGDIVTARLAMSVAYPMPVREVARQVRDRVRGRVRELTGLTVRQVDIEVAELDRPSPGERSVQ